MVLLFDLTRRKVRDYSSREAVEQIYYLKAQLPTKSQIKSSSLTPEQIRVRLSRLEFQVPLYDPHSQNLFLIDRTQVYHRVIRQHYRFPDAQLREELAKQKKKLENLKSKTPLQERTLRKHQLREEFLAQFDLKILEETYYRVFYSYSEEVGKMLTSCPRPSFYPSASHLTPYYSRSELINLALNLKLITPDDTYYDTELLQKLCQQIQKYDLSAENLLVHQEYLSHSQRIGLVQYYTFQGSYFMNQYLRRLSQPSSRNLELERLIREMVRVIRQAPPFDQSHTVYRFIKEDPHLRDLKVGQKYTNWSFISTTRDPFYRSEEFVFGFILVRIKIPAQKGVALSLESYSHFPAEQEIILPPGSELKLISKDKNCPFFHLDDQYQSQIKTRYEFELVGVAPEEELIEWMQEGRADSPPLPQVDFLTLTPPEGLGVEERIRFLMEKHAHPSFQIQVSIHDQPQTLILERYRGNGVYRHLYAAPVEHGFSIYGFSQYQIRFLLEIGEQEGHPYLYINYYFQHSSSVLETDPEESLSLLTFWAQVAHYFRVDRARIFTHYHTCDQMVAKMPGNFNWDLYQYLKHGKKRFRDLKLPLHEMREGFDYFLLDQLSKEEPLRILQRSDRDDLYQLYQKVFDQKKKTLRDFYLFVAEKHCHLLAPLVEKMGRLFPHDNPFVHDYYIFSPLAYLYHRKMIPTIPENHLGERSSEPFQVSVLPKNRYRENLPRHGLRGEKTQRSN